MYTTSLRNCPSTFFIKPWMRTSLYTLRIKLEITTIKSNFTPILKNKYVAFLKGDIVEEQYGINKEPLKRH